MKKIFDFSNLKGDFFGGITAGIVALPLALALGATTDLGVQAGLYGAIATGFFAALFGGTSTQITGPTGPMTVVTAAFMTTQLGSVADPLSVLFMMIFCAGAFQLILGLSGIGKYVTYIPYPVVSGFMSGIGVIIILLQLKDFFGVTAKHSGSVEIIKHIGDTVISANWINVGICLATIAIIYLFPKITKVVPSALVALIIVSFIVWILKIPVPTIEQPKLGGAIIPDPIPSKLPALNLSMFEPSSLWLNLKLAVVPGILLGILGMIDSLLTSVVADKMTKTKHKSNQELIGQGIGNMVSSLFGGLPGAGATVGTVINIKSGGRTRLSGMIHALFLLFILLVAGPVAKLIPLAVLAGILITVGIGILDWTAFRHFKKVSVRDTGIMSLVLVLTVSWDLMYAVGIGLILASLIFMKKMADVVEGESKDSKIDRLVDNMIDSFSNSEEFRKRVYVKNLKGPMFFGFASRFQDSLEQLGPDIKAVILNMSGVTYMDQSGMYTLEEVLRDLNNKNINVCICELREGHEESLRKVDIIPSLVDDEHLFSSVEETVMWLREPGHINNQFAHEDELYIPTAYSPNGDGINDEWQLRNIHKYPNCIVQVFNRDKKEIFKTIGYKEMWEGIYQGRMLPADEYFYKIDLLGDGQDIKEGSVHIFR